MTAPPPAPAPPLPIVSEYDTILVDTIARHFDDAVVEGRIAHLRADGLSISCAVNSVDDVGSTKAASLFFEIWGGALGTTPIFVSVSGYEATAEAAIVVGGCNWACTFGPVLRSALHGAHVLGPNDADEIDELEAVLDGRRFRVVLSGLDRLLKDDSDFAPVGDTLRDVRSQLGGHPWLIPTLLDAGALPMHVTRGASLLSLFVSENRVERTVEVKLNGGEWVPAAERLQRLPAVPRLSVPLLRELAVLVPLEPPRPLAREPIERVLLELGLHATEPWQAAGWQGWLAHRGVLGPPLDEATVRAVEDVTGPLPAGHRHFLTSVAGWGAGPGYGLLRPTLHDGVVPLAHAGCGVTWVLRLDDGHRGEVWVDARGSDE